MTAGFCDWILSRFLCSSGVIAAPFCCKVLARLSLFFSLSVVDCICIIALWYFSFCVADHLADSSGPCSTISGGGIHDIASRCCWIWMLDDPGR